LLVDNNSKVYLIPSSENTSSKKRLTLSNSSLSSPKARSSVAHSVKVAKQKRDEAKDIFKIICL